MVAQFVRAAAKSSKDTFRAKPDAVSFSLVQLRRLLEGTVFYGVLILIALAAVPYGTVDPWWESIFEATVFGLVIVWLLEGALGDAWLDKEHRLLLPLLGLLILALVQSVPLWQYEGSKALADTTLNRTLSADPFETQRFAYKLLAIMLTLGMLLRYTNTERRLRALVYLVVGIAFTSAIFGLVKAELPERIASLFGERLSPIASYAQFESRNHFAVLIEMAIGVLLGLAIGDRRHKKRLILYASIGLTMCVALLLTHSRGGALSLALEVPFFFLLFVSVRNSIKLQAGQKSKVKTSREKLLRPGLIARVAIFTVLLAAVGATVILIGGQETISRIEETAAEFKAHPSGTPKVLRPQIWGATARLIWDNPILGVGFAGYSMAIPSYLNSSGEWMLEQAHNDYLELQASGGLVGAALCLWFFASFVTVARQRLRAAPPFLQAIRCGALAGLFAVAMHSLFDYGLHITINTLVCAILVVLAVKSFDTKAFPQTTH